MQAPAIEGAKGYRMTTHTNGATEGGTVVLLAESNRKSALMIQKTFTELCVLERLTMVEDGAQLLAYLRGDCHYADRLNYPFPNVVLLSSRLPVLSGIAALCCLRSDSRLERLPVVLVGHAFTKTQVATASWMGAACCTKKAFPDAVMQAMAQSVRLVSKSPMEREELSRPATAAMDRFRPSASGQVRCAL